MICPYMDSEEKTITTSQICEDGEGNRDIKEITSRKWTPRTCYEALCPKWDSDTNKCSRE